MAPPIVAETMNCSVVSPTAQDCGASELSVFFVPKEHKALLANHATMHRLSLKRQEASDGSSLRDWSSALAAATAAEPIAADMPVSSVMRAQVPSCQPAEAHSVARQQGARNREGG